MLFLYAVRPLVTARDSDSMFYPVTLWALQIVFIITIIMIISWQEINTAAPTSIIHKCWHVHRCCAVAAVTLC